MKKYLFLLIPILVLSFGISSFAIESENPFPDTGINPVGWYYCVYDASYIWYYVPTKVVSRLDLHEPSYAVTGFLVYYTDNTIFNSISDSMLNRFSVTYYDRNAHTIGSYISGDATYNARGKGVKVCYVYNEPTYDDSLIISPKMLYGLNFIKLFLGKSSAVENVAITINRIYNDGRPSEFVFSNEYSDNNPYIEFWDDFDFPTEDIPHISYQMELVPKDSSGNYGNTYKVDFRLRYNDISGTWKYDIDIPTVTHGGGGHERVPIEGINDYTISVTNPSYNTVVTPPTTYYSPSISNTYIEENDNSTEIYNYITNNYITESPQPIIDNTQSVPTSTDFDFPTLDGFLGVLKGIFGLIKNLFEMFVNLISNLIGQFTFLPPWFIICVSSLIGIAISVMIWLFVKNLIL